MMNNNYPAKRFAISQFLMVLSNSIYGITFMFMVQRYISSEFGNSILGNMGMFVSIFATLFIGHFVDNHSPWKIIIYSNLIIAILFCLPFWVQNQMTIFLLCLVVIDIISSLFSEVDSISRTAYVSLLNNEKVILTLQQHISVVNTSASIIGYLFVFITVSKIQLIYYLLISAVFNILSLVLFARLPKEQRNEKTRSKQLLIKDFTNIFRYIRKHALTMLFTISILLTIRNQMIFSLLIYKIGQVDPHFKHILIIGVGILITVLIGSVLNKVVALIHNGGVLKLVLGCFGILSGLFTYVSGNDLNHLSPFMVGVMIGGIFAFTIPVYAFMETKRVTAMQDSMQGKSSAIIHFISIIVTMLMTFILGWIQVYLKFDAIFFDTSAVITLIMAILVLKIHFSYDKD
jgi:MFS family permease